jgi:hypothetical protein
MKKATIFISFLLCSLMVVSCGGGNKTSNNSLTAGISDNSETYMEENVNAIDQALPEIMILPSDRVLNEFNSLKETSYGIERNYQSYLINSSADRTLSSVIQNEFNQMGYPLNDLEQTLKQLNNRSITDEADMLAKDTKTLLLNIAKPDIIAEFDYKTSLNQKTFKKSLNYTLTFIDAYTNKVISTKTSSSDEKNFTQSLREQMPAISKELQRYFSDILTKGREISVRITVDSSSNINLQDESIEGQIYANWIDDYMDTNTVKGTYRLNTNTKYELSYTNVRIAILNNDGTQHSAYQWGRNFAETIYKKLGVKVKNLSQGLADVHLVIVGI